MKKFFTFGFIAFLLAVSFVTPIKIHAQVGDGMAIYQKFIMGQMKCADLNDADFFAVGDYVLKQVPEAQRSVLNVYIDQYKGTMNDKDFSTLMGKYFTACAVPGTAGTGLLNTSSGDTGKTKLPYGYGGYGWGMMSGFGIFFWFIKLIIGIIILIVVIKIVMLLVRGKKGMAGMMGMTKESPTDILKERYVKGEITKEEYEEKRKEICK